MRKIVCYRSPTSEVKREITKNPNRIMRHPGYGLTIVPTELGVRIDYKLLKVETIVLDEGSVDLELRPGIVYSVDYSLVTKNIVIQKVEFGCMSGVSNAAKVNMLAALQLSDGTILLKVSNLVTIDCVANDFGTVTEEIVEGGTRPYTCFSKFNDEAKEIMEASRVKGEALRNVNFLDSLSYLEAQVDVLTKIILASGICTDKDLKDILESADQSAIWRFNTKEQLLKKMDKKKKFREIQLAYYGAKD